MNKVCLLSIEGVLSVVIGFAPDVGVNRERVGGALFNGGQRLPVQYRAQGPARQGPCAGGLESQYH